jgi:Tol biopolymer transport system component
MNRLERFVYDRLKRNPRIKLIVRDIYQTLFDLLPVSSCYSAYPIRVREGFFFGFHDHTPFSADNQMLLANRYTIGLRMPNEDDELEVGFFHGQDYRVWEPVGRTRAWNWHQGCKLQWRGSRPDLVYNDFVGGKFITRIHNLETGEVSEVPYPISSVSPDGRWAVGYSFERVQRYMPGYGYLQRADEPQLDLRQPDRSGLYLLDLDTGFKQDLVSISQLAEYQPEPDSQNMWHYVSHAIFSPSSKRIVFLHRWVPEDTRARRSRMFSYGLKGGELSLFPTREMVSHLGWRNEQEIVAYCRLTDGRDRYVLFRDQDPERWQILGERLFSSDGHPSFSPDGRWMLTDTYPDRSRRSVLILFDTKSNSRYDIAWLQSPRRYTTTHPQRHWACDLHPRFDRTGRYLCFDSVYTGTRALCTIDLGEAALAEPPKALNVCV